MFIYKITAGNKVYIGLDSGPEHKEHRWKEHCKIAKSNPKTKVHKAMKKIGIENCLYEVVERGFENMVDLALAEIKHIKAYNSYKRGLNSTPGGDGLGKHDLFSMSENEIIKLKEALGDRWKKYNQKKWANMSLEERQKKLAHLHTPEVYARKAETLKKFYEFNPKIRVEKGNAIKKWQRENKELQKQINKKNGLLGAQKMSKQVVVEKENGIVETYLSRSEFQRNTGLWFSTLLEKSKQGLYYKGYKLKNVNE